MILVPIVELLIYKLCEKISKMEEPNVAIVFLMKYLSSQILEIAK
jgi:hypothetical protein